jgi:hypothetical protein
MCVVVVGVLSDGTACDFSTRTSARCRAAAPRIGFLAAATPVVARNNKPAQAHTQASARENLCI